MKLEECVERLKFITSHAGANVNMCAAGYRMVRALDPQDRPRALEEFVKGAMRSETDDSMKLPVVITVSEKNDLRKKFDYHIKNKLATLIESNPDESEFYEKFADFIYNDFGLAGEKLGIIALFVGLNERCLPYHKIDLSGAITMDDDEFKKLVDDVGDDAREIMNCIMGYEYDQRTERAGVALDLIESMQTREQRVYMLSWAFGFLQEKIDRLRFAEIIKMLEDDE